MTYDNITTQYNVARRVGEIYHLYLLASGDHIDVCLEAALKKPISFIRISSEKDLEKFVPRKFWVYQILHTSAIIFLSSIHQKYKFLSDQNNFILQKRAEKGSKSQLKNMAGKK